MLIITKERFEALKERVNNLREIDQCRAELEKMLEIKEALLWRAETASSCCVPQGLPAHLAWEVDLLRETLRALEEGNREKAAAMLQTYASQIE